MSWKITLLASAWLILLGFWILGLLIYKKLQRRRRSRYWFLFVGLIIIITIGAGYLFFDHLYKRVDLLPSFNHLINISGIIFLLSGLSFSIWSRITLGAFWCGSVAFIENQTIIKKGPYAIVRHPIYTGVISMLWGSFLIENIGVLFLTAILGTIFLIFKAMLEESLLESNKGKEYLAYKNKVRRRFFPGRGKV